MPTYLIRHVPSDLIRRAKARAKARQESLDDWLMTQLAAYADADTDRDRRARGGQTTAERRSPEERSAAARRAVQARWARPRQP